MRNAQMVRDMEEQNAKRQAVKESKERERRELIEICSQKQESDKSEKDAMKEKKQQLYEVYKKSLDSQIAMKAVKKQQEDAKYNFTQLWGYKFREQRKAAKEVISISQIFISAFEYYYRGSSLSLCVL